MKVSAKGRDLAVKRTARSRMTASVKVLFVSMAVAGLVAACGGGGGNKTTATTNTNGTTAPTVTKGLWIANGNNVLEYIPSQLAGGVSTAAPHLTNMSGSLGAPQGVTFDSAGNLWVMDPAATVGTTQNTPALLKFSAAQLAELGANNAPTPIATITTQTLAFPQQAAFDAQGNLWVTDHNANNVIVFTPDQLAKTGINALTPAITITSQAFNGPLGITFDANGNLFVANNGGVPMGQTMSAAGTSIVEFSASKLPKPPSTIKQFALDVPDATLNDNGLNSIQAPWALTFDNNGDLWSSNADAPFTLVKFAKADIAKLGASMPTPVVTISPTTVALAGVQGGVATLNAPNGLCFDNLFDLVAPDADGLFGLPFYKNAQLKSGAVVPDTFITDPVATPGVPLNAPAGCSFGPLVN